MAEKSGGLKLVAGLGNPGYEYYLTPHNLGFMAVDRIALACGAEIKRPEAQALIARVVIGQTEVILAKPQTFMNLSGLAVGKLLVRYEIAVQDLMVLVDEADLPLGALRIRDHGTAGSHRGLKSIIGVLESDCFVRIRMGVQPEHPVADLAGYVLGPFRKADLETVAEMVDRAAEAVGVIIQDGVGAAMNRYNRRISS
ncbi:MAG TPA: aminoacyl-tRNA hydrolase [Terriglobia bacterium]|nr:aminoacyl-tRNA hydrolase [Terriglobia bacterium]